MKYTKLQLTGLMAALASGNAFAHVGDHGSDGLVAGIMHMLAQHGHLLPLVAVGVGVLLLARSLRA